LPQSSEEMPSDARYSLERAVTWTASRGFESRWGHSEVTRRTLTAWLSRARRARNATACCPWCYPVNRQQRHFARTRYSRNEVPGRVLPMLLLALVLALALVTVGFGGCRNTEPTASKKPTSRALLRPSVATCMKLWNALGNRKNHHVRLDPALHGGRRVDVEDQDRRLRLWRRGRRYRRSLDLVGGHGSGA
jgi:hypothetical protein